MAAFQAEADAERQAQRKREALVAEREAAHAKYMATVAKPHLTREHEAQSFKHSDSGQAAHAPMHRYLHGSPASKLPGKLLQQLEKPPPEAGLAPHFACQLGGTDGARATAQQMSVLHPSSQLEGRNPDGSALRPDQIADAQAAAIRRRAQGSSIW